MRCLRRRVRDPRREGVGSPVAAGVGGEFQVPARPRHPDDEEADPGPGVQQLVDEAQLLRVVGHEHGGERGAESAAARASSRRTSVMATALIATRLTALRGTRTRNAITHAILLGLLLPQPFEHAASLLSMS
jgi:hypothetical protein